MTANLYYMGHGGHIRLKRDIIHRERERERLLSRTARLLVEVSILKV